MLETSNSNKVIIMQRYVSILLFSVLVNCSGPISGPVIIPNNAVTDTKLRDSVALSVIGRASDTNGDPGDIVAGADGDVLQRSGTSLVFGPLTAENISQVSGSLSSASSGTWAGGTNLTTEGTIDWAAWDAAVTGTSRLAQWHAKQAKPRSTSIRADRIHENIACFCGGASGCNGTSLCSSATANTGGGRSTTGSTANNYALTGLSSSLTGPVMNPTSTGFGATITVKLFPGESGTFKVYLKLLDVSVNWSADLYENGISVSSVAGSYNSLANVTTDAAPQFNFNAGTIPDSYVVFKVTNTARGGTNPRVYVYGATMF